MNTLCLLVLLIATTIVNGNEYYTHEWAQYLEKLEIIAEQNNEIPRPVQSAIGINDFNVSFVSQPEKATVHTLRPQDIDVIGALGDSITAGTGEDATTLAGLAIQYRGLTWTAGGDETLDTSITIPNILRQFNPEVKGYAVGNGIGYAPRVEEDWFNVAIPGARAHDMPDQARELINRMKNDSKTSFENDWKLISIFIGGNDLCAIDRDPIRSAPEAYVGRIKDALDIFHAEVPRALVQIIEIMEIYVLPYVADGFGAGRFCKIVQPLVCGYVIQSSRNDTILEELQQINAEYQRLTEELVASGMYDTRDDFTVVVQPFFKDTVLPYTEDGEVDATYFAPDCFHFSSKGHAMGALNLWNNMFEPEGSKTTQWSVQDLKCPSEDNPFIFTRVNSPRKIFTQFIDLPDDVVCPNVICTTTPDWVIGVVCALVAIAALEAVWLLVVSQINQKTGKKSKKYDGEYKL